MRDKCLACGRVIFTVHAQGFGITLRHGNGATDD